MSDHDIILRIQELMDGQEWSAETLEEIAELLREAGYRVRDLEAQRDAIPAPTPAHPGPWEVRDDVTIQDANGKVVLAVALVKDERGWTVPADPRLLARVVGAVNAHGEISEADYRDVENAREDAACARADLAAARESERDALNGLANACADLAACVEALTLMVRTVNDMEVRDSTKRPGSNMEVLYEVRDDARALLARLGR